jgi:hypothetical protein
MLLDEFEFFGGEFALVSDEAVGVVGLSEVLAFPFDLSDGVDQGVGLDETDTDETLYVIVLVSIGEVMPEHRERPLGVFRVGGW